MSVEPNRPAAALLTPLLILALHAGASAQARPPTPAAEKFDEFSALPRSDVMARLDGFTTEIQRRPDTRAFIIVYRTRRDPPGLSSRMANWSKDYLVHTRLLPESRVVTVVGVADCLKQELWIVPVGATPATREDAYANDYVDTESVRQFDEYGYPLPQDWFYENVGRPPDSLEAFAAALRQVPRADAYVIVYSQYYVQRWDETGSGGARRGRNRVSRDGPGVAGKVFAEVKSELVNKFGIPARRVKFMHGGHRTFREVGLWIVPRGAHPPIPTPNAFPPRHRATR